VPSLRRLRLVLWGAVAFALLFAVGLTAASLVQRIGPSLPSVGEASVGGPFELTTEDGGRLSSASLAGRPFALYFGFTHCPDVCPTSMFEIAKVLEEVGPAAADLRVYFVTVDPARDTPDLLRDYTDSFDPRIVGLTGTEAEIAAVARAYRAFYRKVPTSGGDDYTMDHSTMIYLMDARGRFVTGLGHQEAHGSKVDKVRRLVAGAG
jgi:protein SCO1/2